MRHHAASERSELARTLTSTEPLAPTLDPPWRAQELAAHLVLRGRSPRYCAALYIPRLHPRTEAMHAELIARRGYDQLIADIAAGPRRAPSRLGPIDDALNLLEYVTHHEDLRRAAPHWEPRTLPADRRAAIWSHLRTMAKTAARGAVRGVRLEPTDLDVSAIAGAQASVVARGEVVELMLTALGRARAARIELDGDPSDVQVFRDSQRMP